MTPLYVVGLGPGDRQYLCPAAERAVAASTDLVGYRLYLDLLGPLTADKTRHEPPMGEEIARARLALDLAASGKTTTLVSSGDAGIYALATLVFQLIEHEARPEWAAVAIQVVPGVSAAQALAARAGAPLAHDFCTISLSDLLTPWETIETRLHAAGQGDFVVALYNPLSQKRTWQLPKAKAILLQYRPPETPVVIGQNVTRDGERIRLTQLDSLDTAGIDMLSLVIIGNSETRRTGDWVYTPRGYQKKLISAGPPGSSP